MARASDKSQVDEEALQRMPVSHAYDDPSRNLFESIINERRSSLFLLLLVAVLVIAAIPTGGSDNALVLQCPAQVAKAPNADGDHLEVDYLSPQAGEGNMVLGGNITHFLENFRSIDYDNWGHSFDEVKEGMYHWKSTMYPDNVENGDKIYESACGIGLNLYMTLQILNEIKGIKSLVVYGNEYLAPSTDLANLLFDNVSPFHSKKGSICTADSTNLEFVPSDSFDLVFTGYITPMYDPIHIGNGTINEKYKLYREVCDDDEWTGKKLKALAQEAQEQFYAQWVGEMIRIAKPGKAVIVEQVSHPYCDEHKDWGGVPKEWWKTAIQQYGWDVDPESIVTEKDTIFSNRYHVFLRKNQ